MIVLSELERDALAELFNIGVGAAADVLSQMARDRVALSVPNVDLIDAGPAARLLAERHRDPLCVVRQMFRGAISTEALLMFPEENSLELVRIMFCSEVPLAELTEMEQEAMMEIANIILNAIVARLGEMLDTDFDGALPTISLATGDNLLSAATADAANSSVLMLQIDFELSSRHLRGYLAFLLELDSVEELTRRVRRIIDGLG